MDNQKVGNFIRKKRKEKQLTQQELGDLVGVSFKAVSKWECGNSMPDISILKKVCEILEISVNELLEGKKEPILKRPPFSKLVVISVIIIITIIIAIIFIIKKNQNSSTNFQNIDNKKFECVLTKTYNIDSINNSNDENYLYITFKEYQSEGVYTIKLSKTISQNFEIGENYEFTFNTSKKNISSTPDIIFANSELINIVHSDKIGIEQINNYNCR